ncbi:MAG: DNA polymerase IV [Flavobacteriales bacterium]|nr:DNA polymerase IV [Flavobacteriales bacterium]
MTAEVRLIAHLDIDCFFVQAERLRNPQLMGRAVVVAGAGERAVVSSASYEARRWGVRSGMSVRMARRLCPGLLVVRSDWEYYSRLSQQVTEIVAQRSPLWEKASVDEFYMDFTGMDRYLGAWRWLTELSAYTERETGLRVSAALATSKSVGKVATNQSKPHGRLQVPPGHEKSFLAPLPVQVLPGAGSLLGERLSRMGVRYIATLQSMPGHLMEQVFGRPGLELWLRAQGIDPRPVVPYRKAQSFSEEHTFDSDTDDPALLERTLARMAAHLGHRLRTENFLSAVVTVKLRYADFDASTRSQKITPTACDLALLRTARQLLRKAWARRQRIRLIGLRVSELHPSQPALQLFEEATRQERLLRVLDKLYQRFGTDTVLRASAL